MPRIGRRGVGFVGWMVLALLTAGLALRPVPHAAPLPTVLAPAGLDTMIYPATEQDSPQAPLYYRRMRQAGARFVRFTVYWYAVAPASPAPGFRANDPADPGYDWQAVDRWVKQAAAAHLEVLLTVLGAPTWAEGPNRGNAPQGTWEPSPAALGDFATAIATRYDGSFQGLPRVHDFQVWNEPNISFYLGPQVVGSQVQSPVWFRNMANAFSSAVHAVRADDVVIGAGLAPYGSETPASTGISPLTFTRDVLCMSATSPSTPTCGDRTHLDGWAAHPYTWGSPAHHAFNTNDVALGDLGRERQLLIAAYDARRLVPTRPLQFWVTEFSYDTNPPDPKAVPLAIQARWTSEALWQMWKAGVGVATWFTLVDQAYPGNPFQAGLYYLGKTPAADKPKPTLTAFRFPFVAELNGKGFDLWGRTPTSKPGRVIVELQTGSAWRPVMTLQADRFGIFQGRWDTTRRNGYVRARLINSHDAALAFRLRPVPDTRYPPFG